jgi:hypothetical protein
MSATFNKLFVVTTFLGISVVGSQVMAAPSLGYPKGRPYYGSNAQSSGRSFRSYNYAPAFSGETRQSFSYDPAQNAVKGGTGCHSKAVTPKSAAKADSKKATANAPQATRRSYSYEPNVQAAPQPRTYFHNSAPRKEAWQYQKTDPRRYQR